MPFRMIALDLDGTVLDREGRIRPRTVEALDAARARGLEVVLVTASMDEASKSAWCRENGVYPQELEQWRAAATQALADPEDAARISHREKKADRRRIKELERDLRRKEKALAEAAALLVLSKKLEAIFPKDKDEDA